MRNRILPLTERSRNQTPRGIGQLPEQTLRNPSHIGDDEAQLFPRSPLGDRKLRGAVDGLAAAPTKNIENNPMQSSRRPPQSTVWTENLTRRANQRHNFTIPESAKRLRARNIDAIMFRVARPLRTRRRCLREGAETAKIQLFQNLSGESHTDAV